MPIAFKEWAVTVRALAEGEQLITLRKGALHQAHRPLKLAHERFFLYPTFDQVSVLCLNGRGAICRCQRVGAALVLAIAFGCRLLLCASIERAFGLAGQPSWLIPVHDLISFAVYVASFFGSTVSWRGNTYRVLSDGRLVED